MELPLVYRSEGTKRHDFGISNDSVCRAPLSLFPRVLSRSRPATEFAPVSGRGLFDPYWLGAVPAVTGPRFPEKGDERVDALVDVTPAH